MPTAFDKTRGTSNRYCRGSPPGMVVTPCGQLPARSRSEALEASYRGISPMLSDIALERSLIHYQFTTGFAEHHLAAVFQLKRNELVGGRGLKPWAFCL